MSQPGWGVQVLVLFGMFLGGGALGVYLSDYVAPGSGFAGAIAPLAFLGSMFLGLQLWAGAALALGLLGLLLRPFRRRNGRSRSAERPGGGFVFLPVAIVMSVGAGLLIGAFTSAPLVHAVAVFGGAGAAYGALLWLAAHTGCLPFMLE